MRLAHSNERDGIWLHGMAGRVPTTLLVVSAGLLFASCGLLMDAADLIHPVVPQLPDQLDAICAHEALHVGILDDPSPPFVFPSASTPQGNRVTGLDVELVQAIATTLARHCGRPITPVATPLPFRDLFLALTEGKLDLFVSGMTANAPHLRVAGLGYSTPYVFDMGVTAVTRKPEVADRVGRMLGDKAQTPSIEAREEAFAGLTVAVQDGRSPHLYALVRLPKSRLVLCDTLAAALTATDLPIDVVLGKDAVLSFLLKREHRDWRPLRLSNGEPLHLAIEFYAVALAETQYPLRWLVNDVLFELERSGRLAEMRRRWLAAESADTADPGAVIQCPTCPERQSHQPGRCRLATEDRSAGVSSFRARRS